jgi:hypothetical protein
VRGVGVDPMRERLTTVSGFSFKNFYVEIAGSIQDPQKPTSSCQSPHFGKISEMKSISKPPLPIELYTICQNVSLDNFRKKSSLFHPRVFAQRWLCKAIKNRTISDLP